MSDYDFDAPAPHPSAVYSEEGGLGRWTWRREDGVLQIQLTGKGVLEEEVVDGMAGEYLHDSQYVILAGDEDVDVYKPVEVNALSLFVAQEDDPEQRLLLSLRKRAIKTDVLLPAWGLLRHAAGASKNRGFAAGKATAEGLGKDPSRFIAPEDLSKVDPRALLDDPEQRAKLFKSKKPMRAPSLGTAGYKTVDGYTSATNESNLVYSGIVGNFNWTPRNPYCRQTAFTRDHFDEFLKEAMPFIEEVNSLFSSIVPGRYARQRDWIDGHRLREKDWMLGSTVFSTITVNKNYRTGTHKDAGDYAPGFGNLTVLEGGAHKYKGGRTVFPRFRCAVDLRHGDFLGMDVHEWHGNTKLESVVEGEDDWERISVVCYVRVEMEHCGDRAEEDTKRETFFRDRFKNPEQRHADTMARENKEREDLVTSLSSLGAVDAETIAPKIAPPKHELPDQKHLTVLEAERMKSVCPHGKADPEKDCRECPDFGEECVVEAKKETQREKRERSKRIDAEVAAAVRNHEAKFSGDRTVLWIVGEPGVGKTTFVRGLLGDRKLVFADSPKWTEAGEDWVLAGHYKGDTFDGADQLSTNVGPIIIHWEVNYSAKAALTILDGDRFSFDGAKESFSRLARTRVIQIVASEEITEARRKQRGSNQNASWVKGRKTKSARFAGSFTSVDRLVLNGSETPDKLVEKAVAWLNGAEVASYEEPADNGVLDIFG